MRKVALLNLEKYLRCLARRKYTEVSVQTRRLQYFYFYGERVFKTIRYLLPLETAASGETPDSSQFMFSGVRMLSECRGILKSTGPDDRFDSYTPDQNFKRLCEPALSLKGNGVSWASNSSLTSADDFVGVQSNRSGSVLEPHSDDLSHCLHIYLPVWLSSITYVIKHREYLTTYSVGKERGRGRGFC